MDIANIRLGSHQLKDTPLKTPEDMVARMGAMQAQNYNMAKWAIGIRIPELTDAMVEEAFNKGEILRTHVMRPTWHFVAPKDIRWMLSLSAKRIKSAMQVWDNKLELNKEIYIKSNKILEKVLLGNKHLTRDEIVLEFEKNGIKMHSARIYHIMMGAEQDGIVCSGAIRGKEQTYALLDERAPQATTLLKDEALARLALTYFKSHSPATLQDFIWWSGLSTTEARHAIEMVKTEFISETINSQTFWIHNSFQEFSTDNQSVLLLPAFDEYIIAYKDRKAVLPFEHHTKAISSNGIFRPTILKNGKVIGIWKKSTTKNKVIVPDFFEVPDQTTLESIDRASTIFEAFINN
jgi:hypothetical protein